MHPEAERDAFWDVDWKAVNAMRSSACAAPLVAPAPH
jgi:hypothetical protein